MQPPGGKPWLLFGLLGASLATNLVMALWWPDCPSESPEPAAALQVEPVPAASSDPAATTNEAEVARAAAATPLGLGDYQLVQGVVEANLARTFQGLLVRDADAVNAVFARQFVWDLDLRRDLQKGDEVTAVFLIDDLGDIDMPLAKFRSNKLGRELATYRFQAPGDDNASYWFPDGTEVPYRLIDGPIDQYIQITALLDDRRGHEGWDFKAPEGAPVQSPKAGRVERSNWNHAMNGNCLEIVQDDGVHALYLHLSRNDVKPGDRITAGQQVGLVGNTGRSTSAHLHYQVEKAGKVLDPGDYHETFRRTLPPEAMPAFQQEMAHLEAMVGAG